jgi:hypothetical protein
LFVCDLTDRLAGRAAVAGERGSRICIIDAISGERLLEQVTNRTDPWVR